MSSRPKTRTRRPGRATPAAPVASAASDIAAIFRLGVEHHAAGRLDAALSHFRLAYAHAPERPEVAGALGITLRDLGRAAEAVEVLSDAVQHHPGSAGLLATFGSALQASGKLRDAVARYEAALQLDPGLAPARANLGLAWFELGAIDQAIAAYRRALTSLPDSPELHVSLGWALFAAGSREAARGHFEHALGLRPQSALAHEKLGLARLAFGDIAGASRSFARNAELMRGGAWSADERARGEPRTTAPAIGKLSVVSAYKLAHDADQLRYLRGLGLAGVEAATLATCFEGLKGKLEAKLGRQAVVPLDDELAKSLGSAYGAPYTMPDCPALPGGALNPELDGPMIEAAYRSGQPEAVTIDGLLRTEALDALRHFCHAATMWNDVKRGYMGAYLRHGFGAPLLVQIAAELRAALPKLLGPHPLIEMWAYKYDHSLNGIETHADCAAVNVNFWLAPDEANLDPASGGLEVFTAAAPASWDFHRYNHDSGAIERFLDEAGRRSLVVPHRANRAVLFNSNLFHRTHDPRFKPGYLNRRINITMLFGFRATNAA